MSEIRAKANSEDVGLRRESTLDSSGLPLWLARLHRALPVGATVKVDLRGDLPIDYQLLIEGAGFSDEGPKLVRERTLPDTITTGLRVVMVGLNPSLRSADAGYGYAGANNRFWDAAISAGLLEVPRDHEHALTHERVGFTDLAKRATARASEVSSGEFRAGLVRLDHVCTWAEPGVVIVAGLTGWRKAVSEKRRAGWQPERFGSSPVYLMPNPSGLNAATSMADLVQHLETAIDGPPSDS